MIDVTLRRTAIALTSAIVLIGCAQEAPQLSKEAQGEFVRAYLLENPEVIIEALEVYQVQQQQEAEAERLAALPNILNQNGAPSVGPEDAAITIVEFFDYNCGYCKRAADWVMNAVDHSSDDVRVIFMDLPILAESSEVAARASLASEVQGKYREYHLALMAARGLNSDKIFAIAEDIGLDVERLKRDMESDTVRARLQQQVQLAQQAGVQATPGFFFAGNGQQEFVSGYNEQRLNSTLANFRKAG